ncbi:acetolactate synthase small subunit [Paenibacillus hamazuiensis]|uniref:acetolactate synthase small subunit n=1 Tax=Paenibacillus hamazuiensis TaxID=2936508 RepID=UPI0023DEDB7E|nr:acetolactate synthase small subunit [Paenibacillus hamazuiensis]
MITETHTLSVLVGDHPGVLQRIAGLFSRRSFNIESITVGRCEQPGLSRMIIVTKGGLPQISQVIKQLEKLIDVIRVEHLNANPMVSREMAFLKVSAVPEQRPEIVAAVEIFRGDIIDIGTGSMIVQVTGSAEKLDALKQLLEPYEIIEETRVGTIAMARGMR